MAELESSTLTERKHADLAHMGRPDPKDITNSKESVASLRAPNRSADHQRTLIGMRVISLITLVYITGTFVSVSVSYTSGYKGIAANICQDALHAGCPTE
jgi:hypothetical protein